MEAQQPSFPRIRRLDELWFKVERVLCGALFLFMALLVFADVVRNVFTTRREWLDIAVLFAFTWAAVRTRVLRDGETRPTHAVSLAIALGLTAAITGAVYLYTESMPGGFIWGPKMALCLMLWVAFFGASMATYEKAHLSLEFGEKLWPSRALRYVKAFARAVTAAFCVLLLWLSIYSIADHYDAWGAADGFGETVPTMDWLPQWVVYLVFPYVFAAMSVRLLAQTYTIATGTDVEPEEQLPT